MHLADTFIQSDLQCIQAIHIFPVCVPWELNPQPFALLTQCSTTEPQEHIYNAAHLNTKPLHPTGRSARDLLILLLEVKSSLAILFGFHFGMRIKSDVLCCTVIIYKSEAHLHLSSSVHKLFLCICCEFVHLRKLCSLTRFIK